MGTIELNANAIKTRRLAGAQTIDFPGFMRDAVIAGFYFQCPLFSNSVLGDGKETTVFIAKVDSGWDEEYAPGKWRERRPSVRFLFPRSANATPQPAAGRPVRGCELYSSSHRLAIKPRLPRRLVASSK